MKNQRIGWVDVFRGIMIILMVVGHTWSPFNKQIYLFHIPAFFFISGYTANSDQSWRITLRKSFLNRLLPFFVWNLLLIVICCVVERLSNEAITFTHSKDPLVLLSNLFLYGYTTDMGGATWFLLSLFWCGLLAKACFSVGKKWGFICEALATILIAGGGYALSTTSFIKPYCIDLGMIAIMFYQIGNWSKRREWKGKIDRTSFGLVCAIVFLFHAVWWQYEQNWPTRAFGHLPVMIVGSLAAIYLCCLLSQVIEDSILGLFLRHIGKRTYAIMCGHFIVFRLTSIFLGWMKLIEKQETSAFPTPDAYWYINTVMALLVCFVVSKISEHWKFTNYLINARM